MTDFSKYPNYVPLEKMIKHDNVPQFMVVHHSANLVDNFDIIQSYHITDPGHLWENVGYHYVCEHDGKIKNGRPDYYHGAHVKEQSMNYKSIGICLCGDFDKTLPTEAQVTALKGFLTSKMAQYNIPLANVLPHRHYALNADGKPYKSCYGNRLSDTFARDLVSTPQSDTRSIIDKIMVLLQELKTKL